MKVKNIIAVLFIVFSLGCVPLAKHHAKTSSATELAEYKDVNFSNLYEKDRAFPALETSTHVILDGVLSSSSKTHLSKKQSKLLGEYVRQNKLFCQKGFDQKWMNQLKSNLALLEKTENNRIASAVNKKMQSLFSARQC